MSASLRFLASDQSTVVTSDDMGNVLTPGNSTQTQYYINNFGSDEATSVVLSIEAFGTNDGSDYLYTAEDIAGSPGTFAQTDIAIGTIAALASTPFWVQVTQPAGLTADFNPRRANVVATGLTI